MLNISYLQGGVSRKEAKEQRSIRDFLTEANFKKAKELNIML
jgi:hypothetical protein